MQAPLEITFRDMTASPSAEAFVERWADRLERAYDRIEHCAVTIEVPHRSQRQGKKFHVRIELRVPDQVIVVSRDPGVDPTHQDVFVAISDAFLAARRRLQEHARIQRGEVKHHA
jgi:ribosome-associated translation inhibitor RaiA